MPLAFLPTWLVANSSHKTNRSVSIRPALPDSESYRSPWHYLRLSGFRVIGFSS